MYITNAFSLNMLAADDVVIRARKVQPSEIPEVESAIGHADMAAVVSSVLGRPVPYNRVDVKVNVGDILYVAQYRGPRLPEGATALPAGATIEFWEVKL